MGNVTYGNGIAILQLIIFPFVFAAAIFIWKRTGWRIGGRIWRYPATLSLIRIAGSISSLLSINNNSPRMVIAEAVCQLIGIAPLLLTYIGVLRQTDTDTKIPPRASLFITIITIVALILGIAGVNTADDGNYKNGLTKAAMGIFLAVYIILISMAAWLWSQINRNLKQFQKKLFLAFALSMPFVAVRLVYSAISDYTDIPRFQLGRNETVYLCMSVLEEIFAMTITMVLAISAVRQKDFVKLGSRHQDSEVKPDTV